MFITNPPSCDYVIGPITSAMATTTTTGMTTIANIL
jgi:hypothetical protein